ncbi:exodeoxyribonuclease V subunit gamma [Aliidiomarina minuta]|uniref:RecBCD enzyme subunit RecC n=1 Tax=Aliidiomarina minuta TaxID=880057 RepID=A0A432W5X6_9GAMM|nr:exodeoxyribonuclease V subunit gamma [Aliidiomarina minuta]RUO25442.1 exodeoxyribonuclease V subunit gamma [Aliidiomarina minuta]
MSELTPGFIVAHSHRLEDLTDVAVQLSKNHPLAPLQEETILVQSNGIAQWLKTELARATGIATMLDISLPARFVWKAYRAVLGKQIPKHSPFDKDRLVWRLMRLLPALMESNPAFATLRRYTENDEDQRKLYQLSEKIADLLDQYQVYRADWLDEWTQGVELEGANQWQPELWRALVADIGAQDIWSNRAALHQHFIEQAKKLAKRPSGLPPRVIVFGISSLPQQTLEVLNAIKGYTQVLLCVHNPCQHFWADIVDGREMFRRDMQARQARKTDNEFSMDELHQHAQPLLASWGKQGRDYIRLLDLFDETRQKEEFFNDLRFDIFDETPAQTLLQQLQSDILNLRPLAETHDQWQRQLAASDTSIVLHNAHSPQREVEILHDQLLAAFAADTELKPRDIMVMVPDINAYAPYIDAVFGRLETKDKRFIPYTIADQGERHRKPLLIALEMIMGAPESRFASSDIFDLLHVPALQKRFKIDPADVEQIQQWAEQSGARWGLHGLHRQSLGLDVAFDENSWHFALQRMLYGYAAGELQGEPWQQIEPFTPVSGIQARIAGALAELLEYLERYWQLLAERRTVAEWHPLLNQLLDDFFVADTDNEQLLLSKLRSFLDSWLEASDEAAFGLPVGYNIIQELWLSSMDETGLNQRFMAGAVNFATLMPMRAIPFKKVCLLGMNDADYPRTTTRPDFDLMAQDYRPGDRSRREDDRYLFLEALLSAREQFYISWIGQNSRDNSDIPASVLVGQLCDHLVAGWATDDSDEARDNLLEQLTTKHFLQPFSAHYFATSDSSKDYFTYAAEWQAIYSPGQQDAATALLPEFRQQAPFSIRPWVDLLKEPARVFMQQRLGVYLPDYANVDLDDELFVADNLNVWQFKNEILTELVSAYKKGQLSAHGEDVEQHIARSFKRIQRRGELPLSQAAEQVKIDISASSQDIFDTLRGYLDSFAEAVPDVAINVELNGMQLAENCSNLYRLSGNEQVSQLYMTASKVVKRNSRRSIYTYRNLLEPWLRHLLLCQHFQQPVQTVIVGEGGAVTLPPIDNEQASLWLQDLAVVMQRALREPLPVALALGLPWLEMEDEKRSESALHNIYEGSAFSPGQKEHLPYLARFYGDVSSLLHSDDFAALSAKLYQPLLDTLSKETSK